MKREGGKSIRRGVGGEEGAGRVRNIISDGGSRIPNGDGNGARLVRTDAKT